MKYTIPDISVWLKIVPELTFFKDPAERAAAWRRAFKTFQWRYIVTMILVMSLVSLLSVPLFNFLMSHAQALLGAPRLHSGPEALLRAVFSGLLAVIGTGPGLWLFRRRIQRSLRSQLIERGVPICFECGYDLRGQLEPRCPECGTAFDPSLIKPNDALRK